MNEQIIAETETTKDILESNLSSIKMCLGYLIVNSNQNVDKNQVEKIEILSRLGFEKELIALVLDTTEKTVKSRLSDISKKKKTENNKP